MHAHVNSFFHVQYCNHYQVPYSNMKVSRSPTSTTYVRWRTCTVQWHGTDSPAFILHPRSSSLHSLPDPPSATLRRPPSFPPPSASPGSTAPPPGPTRTAT